MDNTLYTFRVELLKDRKKRAVIETRRFSLPRAQLSTESLYNAFGSGVLNYSYEEDQIALRTDADVAEMLRIVQPENNLFQLFCYASDRSFAASVVQEGKKLAEEAIVLGVRGSSYVQSRFHRSSEELEAPASEFSKSPPSADSDQTPLLAAPAPNEANPLMDGAKKVARGVKGAAEEVLVLGVRGYSYMEQELARSASNASEDMEPLVLDQEDPIMTSSWVNVENADEIKSESPVSAAPIIAVDPELQVNLVELSAMGFGDEELNKTVLMRNKNSLEAAITELLSPQ